MADKRYAITLEMEVDIRANNDYMARKIAHKIKANTGSTVRVEVKEIAETPFGMLITRELEDISNPDR